VKQKPVVKNELFLEDVLTLNNEDKGVTLRFALQYGDMLRATVHKPTSNQYKEVLLLFTSEQVEQLITLWTEWKEQEGEDIQSD
jgi:hypothetical protein